MKKYMFLVFLWFAFGPLAQGQSCFSLTIGQALASPGDTVCLPVTATGFQSVVGFQHSINWNPEELSFVSLSNFGLPGLQETNFGLIEAQLDQGLLTTSWYDPALNTVSIPDNDTLFVMCFLVKAIDAESTPVTFANGPTGSEVIFNFEDASAIPAMIGGAVHLKLQGKDYRPILLSNACVTPASCSENTGAIHFDISGGVSPFAFIWNGPVSFSSEQKDAMDLAGGVYQLEVIDADANRLSALFNVNSGEAQIVAGISTLCHDSTNDVTLIGAAFSNNSGPLAYQWSNGFSETNSNGSSSITVPRSGVYDLTVTNVDGCQFVTNQVRPAEYCESVAPSLLLSLPDVMADPGDTVSLPLRVRNFKEITRLDFSLEWDLPGLRLIGTQLQAPFDSAQVTTNGLQVGFEWSSVSPQNLPDDAIILELTFVVDFEGGRANVKFRNTPTTILAQDDQGSVGVITNDGSVSIDPFEAVALKVANGIVSPGKEICLPVTVTNFEEILGLQFQLSWDTTALAFERVQSFGLPQLTESNFGVNQVEEGKLQVSWIDLATVGQSLEANSTLFEVCLSAKNLEDTTMIQIDTTGFGVEFIRNGLVEVGYEGTDGVVLVVSEVWPGDADVNGIVDQFDLFNIGLAYGEKGPQRPGASLNWEGQLGTPWGIETPLSGIDFRFADTDGNGVVDADDVQALSQNWKRTYQTPGSGIQYSEVRSNGTPLYLDVDTLRAGEDVDIPIVLGTPDQMATSVYSIGFSIVYDPGLIKSGSVGLNLDQSWLQNQGDQLIHIIQHDIENGRIDLAISRTDGNSITGFGELGRISITIEDVIFENRDEDSYSLAIEQVRQIDAQERLGAVAPETSEVVVEVVSSTQAILPAHLLKVYPNPVSSQLQVEWSDGLVPRRIELLDLTGKKMISEPTQALSHQLEVDRLESGVYILQVITDAGIIHQRILKQ